jgi:TP53 regulating kinase-like protein
MIVMLFKKGAEAYLYKEEWYGMQVIRKHRVQKNYRVSQLDYKIRRSRTIHEARLIYEAGRVGVPTPSIYFVNPNESTIVMEYVEGDKLKDTVDSLGKEELEKVFRKVGRQIGMLHGNDIIHGDLTTSNMIQTPSEKIFFVDFGLGEFSSSIENRGVDMHLMHRALESTHYEHSIEGFRSITEGYTAVIGEKRSAEVLKRVHEIESRGRYFKREANIA